MHPHTPRPRRKATRMCTDTAGVVRTVHGELMWPFTARVNDKTAPIRTDRRRCDLPRRKGRPQADSCSTVKRPTPSLPALLPMTARCRANSADGRTTRLSAFRFPFVFVVGWTERSEAHAESSTTVRGHGAPRLSPPYKDLRSEGAKRKRRHRPFLAIAPASRFTPWR